MARHVVTVIALLLSAALPLGCSGSSGDDNDSAGNRLALPRLMTEVEAFEESDCVVICKYTPHYQPPAGVGVIRVDGVPQPSDEVLDRCDKILPCRALRNGNH